MAGPAARRCGMRVVAFAYIDMRHSSTRFMIDFGGQWPAAVYNSVQFVYLGLVLGYTGVVIIQNRSRLTTRASSIGFTMFAVGCVVGIALVVDLIGMNLSHLMGWWDSFRFLQSLYGPMFFVVMALICTGLAIPGAVRASTLARLAGRCVDRSSAGPPRTARRKRGAASGVAG
jgi:hypothetical protein